LAQGKAMRLLRKSGASDKAGSRGRTIIALTMTAVAGLAACSSTPKALNPVELYRSAAGFSLNDDTSGERNAQNLAAGSNEPYPNLGTVPPPPDRAMSSIDRQKLQQGLTEDRTQAKQSDADLRASGTAMAAPGAPTPITRPSSAGDDAAAARTKHKSDASLPGGRASANGTHRRMPAGSEPAPQETALNSPDVHAMPQGDTPRPAPPRPSLPPPEKARRPAPDQASKSAPGATTAKRPAPAPQTAATTPQPPTAAPTMPPAAPVASAPPPPPSDMTMPPGNMATVDPVPSLPPAAAPTAAPTMPPAAPVATAPPPPPSDMTMPPGNMAAVDPVPALPPATAPGAASPAPPGASDPQKLSAEQLAALGPARSPPAPGPTPLPAPPSGQQAKLSPAPQATPRAPAPDPAMEPTPQRTGRGGTVSLQAAEIDFADNSMALTADDDRRLAGVVKLYDKHGGIVRVVGYGRRGFGADAAQQELASFSKAIERANVVARALAQLGLASNRIVVQAAPIGDGLGEDRAEVLLEF
jgi:outer membrane protein OmpA-like peptidoglycan-associated protein